MLQRENMADSARTHVGTKLEIFKDIETITILVYPELGGQLFEIVLSKTCRFPRTVK